MDKITPVEKGPEVATVEEEKPLNLDEVRNTTDINEIARRLEQHSESAPLVEKIRKEAARILGRSIIDVRQININDIREELDREPKTDGIHRTSAEKLCEAIDSLLHTAESLDYVKSLLEK